MLTKSFWLPTFKALTVSSFFAMAACIAAGKMADDTQFPLWKMTEIQWLCIALGFLPLYLGSLMVTITLSERKNSAPPQEESS